MSWRRCHSSRKDKETKDLLDRRNAEQRCRKGGGLECAVTQLTFAV